MEEIENRILMIAYACDPQKGGEPGAGWGYLKLCLDAKFRVILLTQPKNESSILEHLDPDSLSRVTILSHGHSKFVKLWKNRLPGGVQIAYLIWNWSLRKKIGVIENDFNLFAAWHVTFASDSLPTALSALKSTPLIWGPVGGFYRFRMSTLYHYGLRGATAEVFRLFTTSLYRNLFTKRLARKANLVLTLNEDVFNYFSRFSNCIIEPNVFMSEKIRKMTEKRQRYAQFHAQKFKIVGVGRLVPLKGWNIAIKTLNALPDNYTLDIFGNGSELAKLKNLAKTIGVNNRLKIDSKTYDRLELLSKIQEYDFFLFPSFHDSCGWALWEAISLGLDATHSNTAGPATIWQLWNGGKTSITNKSKVSPFKVSEIYAQEILNVKRRNEFRTFWLMPQNNSNSRLDRILYHAHLRNSS